MEYIFDDGQLHGTLGVKNESPPGHLIEVKGADIPGKVYDAFSGRV
jgi:hypothetical protein